MPYIGVQSRSRSFPSTASCAGRVKAGGVDFRPGGAGGEGGRELQPGHSRSSEQNAAEDILWKVPPRLRLKRFCGFLFPVMNVRDGVLTLKLIGTPDSQRTQVVMDDLLQTIFHHGAEIAIIDITGVPTADAAGSAAFALRPAGSRSPASATSPAPCWPTAASSAWSRIKAPPATARRIRAFEYPCPPEATLVTHSDGLASSWWPLCHLELLGLYPRLAAALFHRDYGRGHDDGCVPVAEAGTS